MVLIGYYACLTHYRFAVLFCPLSTTFLLILWCMNDMVLKIVNEPWELRFRLVKSFSSLQHDYGLLEVFSVCLGYWYLVGFTGGKGNKCYGMLGTQQKWTRWTTHSHSVWATRTLECELWVEPTHYMSVLSIFVVYLTFL